MGGVGSGSEDRAQSCWSPTPDLDDSQTKLLRVIEERRVLRVGGRAPHDIDVRFVAATHRDLEREVPRGTFREDLYYRLAGITFTVPPLRERRTEIAPLARMFLTRACAEQARTQTVTMSHEFAHVLERYTFPGNVRELRNVIERAVALCRADTLLLEHLPPKLAGLPATTSAVDPPDRRAQLEKEMESLERERITEALDKTGGNQTLAAELLGISRRTLVYRLTALGLPRPRKKD